MLYMIYSEWGESDACIINFIEGEENAAAWAKHFFFQYHDSTPDYIDFHWQDIKVKLMYTRDREFKFHPNPTTSISNGYCTTIVVPVDYLLSVDELMQIPQFNARIFPWGEIIDQQFEHQYYLRDFEKN